LSLAARRTRALPPDVRKVSDLPFAMNLVWGYHH